MIVTVNERRTVLKLLNVSEAARELGVGVFELHKDIKAGRVQSAQIRIGRRVYFEQSDLSALSQQLKKKE